MLENYELKSQAWKRVKGSWLRVVFLAWPLILWQIFTISHSARQALEQQASSSVQIISPTFFLSSIGQNLWTDLVEAVIIGVLGFGVVWTLIEWRRESIEPRSPLISSFRFFGKATVMDAVVLMGIRFLYTILWSMLFIIPGIIKGFAYSQAEFIYAEDVKAGLKIESMNEYITRSRDMMDGHKMQYFWLRLGFIPWWILVEITGGIAGFWVLPYYEATMAEFYLELRRERQFGSRAEIRAARPYPKDERKDDEI